MSFLRQLFGPPDPTRNWPKHIEGPIPVLDLSRPAFGSLIFGDPLEAAEHFGRPSKIKIHPRALDLYYPNFELAFEDNQFVQCQVHIHRSPGEPTGHVLRLTNGLEISHATHHEAIVTQLGHEFDREQWDNCCVMQYFIGKMVFEAMFDEDHITLLYITVYLN